MKLDSAKEIELPFVRKYCNVIIIVLLLLVLILLIIIITDVHVAKINRDINKVSFEIIDGSILSSTHISSTKNLFS